MNKYFIQMFLEESTVIIPNLGALTVTNEETKEIMFLPYLKFDDGKLADFISEAEGVDKVAASNMISKFVREIQAKLDQGESYDIFEFGSFSKKIDGEVEFTSIQMMEGFDRNEMITAAEAPISFDPEEIAEEEEEEEEEDKETPSNSKDEDTEDHLSFELNADEPIEEKISSEELLTSILNKNVSKPQEPNIPEIQSEDLEEDLNNSLDKGKDELEDVSADEQEIMDEVSINETLSSQGKIDIEPLAKKLENQVFEENVLVDKPSGIEKKKKRFSFAFVLLWLLLFCFLGAGVWTYFNFEKVKPHLPFLAENKDEYISPLSSDEDHIKVMQELSGMSDSTELDDMEGGEDTFKESAEPKKVTPAIIVQNVPVKIAAKETPKKEVKQTPEKTQPTVAPKISGTTGSGNNFIIVGSFSSGANAENLASKFKKQGFDAITLPNGAMTMVSVGSFATVDEAQDFMSKNSSILKNGWVYKK